MSWSRFKGIGFGFYGGIVAISCALLFGGCATPERSDTRSPPSSDTAAATDGPAPGPDATHPTSSTDLPDAAASATSGAKAPPPVDPNAPVTVVDLHVDTPYQIFQKGRDVSLPEGHATIPELQRGHYEGIVYPIYIADYLNGNNPRVEDAEAILKVAEKLIRHHPELSFARDGRTPGTIAAFLSIEGAGAFAKNISQIDSFIQRGVVLIGPVHAKDNALATSATGAAKGKRGLSDTGKAFCDRVYQGGALVDVSHMSDRSFADLVPIAEKYGAPIIATHSNARAIADSPRNLTDEQLRTIAQTGGVAGLNLHSPFLSGQQDATIADAVKQVRHMMEVAGVEHVAIGSDFDGGRPPDDLADASMMPDLAKALEADGVARTDVRKIFSGNALRVIAWSSSKSSSANQPATTTAEEK